jgi:GMP synthase (glutamine-hydrolysing)
MNIRILLLQARHADDAARLEERNSFAKMAGIPEDRVIPYDLLADTPNLATVRRFDALMIGGSGDYYVSKGNLPNFQAVLDLLAGVAAAGHPTFASCFGFQLLVRALGGEICYDPDHMEVGTFTLTLTGDGRSDELFCHLPNTFQAQLGRKDRASLLPPEALHLAYSQDAPYQALRLPGKPIWATQFHPELTRETNLGRFRRYMDGYASVLSPGELQQTLDSFDESPEANLLIGRFVQTVFS